jgi:predicted Ser/Thr protein kinase
MAAIDIPALAVRIAAIAETYDDTAPEVEVDNRYEGFVDTLRGVTMDMIRHQRNYWKGLRVVEADEFAKCVTKKKQLGAGAYGAVFDMPVKACFRVPASVKRVAVKIEVVRSGYSRNQEPARVKGAIAVAKKAHSLGIAPAIYDAFIVFDTDGIKIVKVYEVLKGVEWSSKVWKPTEKEKANAELQQAVAKMNRAGIIHHDLHPGNVMVTTKGVRIIDFDFANFVKDEEQGQLHSFNSSFPSPWMPHGIASDKGIKYIYHKLVEEGTIRFTKTKTGK